MEAGTSSTKKRRTLGKGVEQVVALFHAEIINTLASRGFSERKFKFGVKKRVANLDYLTEARVHSLMKGIEKIAEAREANVRGLVEQKIEAAKQFQKMLTNDLQKEKSQWLYTRSFFRWLPFRVLNRIKNDLVQIDATIKTLEMVLQLLEVTLLIKAPSNEKATGDIAS